MKNDSRSTRHLFLVFSAMPNADIIVMEDLRHALRDDTDQGGDILGVHPIGVHLKDTIHQRRAVGDLVGNRDALQPQMPADGRAVAVEVPGEFIDAGTFTVTLSICRISSSVRSFCCYCISVTI